MRTQQVILHESGVANTVDPLGGSYFVERLTSDLETDVLRYFDQINALGGLLPAIEAGFFHREILESSVRFQREVQEGERVIVGVNKYDEDDGSEIPILNFDPEGPARHLQRLRAVRGERDQSDWAAALTRLEGASRDPRANTMPYIVEAVSCGATVGEVCDVWRRVFGEYREILVV